MSEELKSVLDNLDKVGKKLDQVSNDNTASINAIKSEIKSLGDKQLELSKELAAMQQTASQQIESQKSAETSSIGDKLSFQLYRDNKLMEVEVTVFERTPDVKTTASPEETGAGTTMSKSIRVSRKACRGSSRSSGAPGRAFAPLRRRRASSV